MPQRSRVIGYFEWDSPISSECRDLLYKPSGRLFVFSDLMESLESEERIINVHKEKEPKLKVQFTARPEMVFAYGRNEKGQFFDDRRDYARTVHGVNDFETLGLEWKIYTKN